MILIYISMHKSLPAINYSIRLNESGDSVTSSSARLIYFTRTEPITPFVLLYKSFDFFTS